MRSYLWLEVRRQWRSREALLFRLGLPTAVYLILTAAVGDTFGETYQGLPAAGARMVALAALGAVTSGLFATGPSLAQERAIGWLRQLRVTPLRPGAVVAAKVVAAMTFALPSIGLVAAAAGLTAGMQLGWERWLAVIVAMWLASAPFAALGLAIGLSFRDPDAAQGATTLAFVVLWLLGGLFTGAESMPDAVAAVTRTLPSYGLVEIGGGIARGDGIPGSSVALLTTWTLVGATVGALAWHRVAEAG